MPTEGYSRRTAPSRILYLSRGSNDACISSERVGLVWLEHEEMRVAELADLVVVLPQQSLDHVLLETRAALQCNVRSWSVMHVPAKQKATRSEHVKFLIFNYEYTLKPSNHSTKKLLALHDELVGAAL
jgi:hypothetical protein